MSNWEKHVYVIGSPWNTLVKIGVSNDPKGRLASIGCLIPFPVELIWMSADKLPRGTEGRIHQACSDFRVYGEWFDFKGEDPMPRIEKAIKPPPVIFRKTSAMPIPGNPKLLTTDEGWQVRRMIQEAKLSQAMVAVPLGMTRANLNQAINGRYGVSDDFPQRIEEAVKMLALPA